MNKFGGFACLLLLLALLGITGPAPAQDQEAERRGTVTGTATTKGGFWIEVKADGEEKARRYFCGSNPDALKAVKNAEVGSRIRLEWRFQEVFRVVKIDVIRAAPKK